MHHIPQHACIHECILVYMTNERIFMFKQQIYLTVSLQIIIYFAAICKYTQRVWAYWYNHMKLLDYLIKLLMVHPYTLLIPTVNWSNLKEWFCPIKVEFLNWAFIDWNLLVDSFLLIWNESLLCVTHFAQIWQILFDPITPWNSMNPTTIDMYMATLLACCPRMPVPPIRKRSKKKFSFSCTILFL